MRWNTRGLSSPLKWKFDYIVFRKKNNESETEWRFGFNDWWIFECSQRKLFYILLSQEMTENLCILFCGKKKRQIPQQWK